MHGTLLNKVKVTQGERSLEGGSYLMGAMTTEPFSKCAHPVFSPFSNHNLKFTHSSYFKVFVHF